MRNYTGESFIGINTPRNSTNAIPATDIDDEINSFSCEECTNCQWALGRGVPKGGAEGGGRFFKVTTEVEKSQAAGERKSEWKKDGLNLVFSAIPINEKNPERRIVSNYILYTFLKKTYKKWKSPFPQPIFFLLEIRDRIRDLPHTKCLPTCSEWSQPPTVIYDQRLIFFKSWCCKTSRTRGL